MKKSLTNLLLVAILAARVMAQENDEDAMERQLPLQREEDREIIRKQDDAFSNAFKKISKPISDSVVFVWAGAKKQVCVGTVITDGHHVLTKWSEIAKVKQLGLQCVGNLGTRNAIIEGVYENEDLALLRLDGESFPALTWVLDDITPGTFLCAVAPQTKVFTSGVASVKERELLRSNSSVAEARKKRLEVMEHMGGSLSGVRDDFPLVVQTDLILEPEQCGGPVVDLEGKVRGITLCRAGRIRSYIVSTSYLTEMLKKKPVEEHLAKIRETKIRPSFMDRFRGKMLPPMGRADVEQALKKAREFKKLKALTEKELQELERK